MIAEGPYQPISGIRNLVKEYTEADGETGLIKQRDFFLSVKRLLPFLSFFVFWKA